MTCQHLSVLEAELIAAGVKGTCRGAAWSENRREWVYFDVVFETAALASRMNFPPCVKVHENLDPKSDTVFVPYRCRQTSCFERSRT